ncbi:histidine kinase [Sphingobium mellinum]|uniref:histidine kinase n=1 Tax=Sphingobium mellinum TaxID=1387166 RepID=UPI0030EE7AF9
MKKRSSFSPVTLLGRASAIALAVGCGAGAAQVQKALQGTPSVVSGSVYVSPNTDSVQLNSSQAVINWTPDDTSGTGAIDFLPAGKTVTFSGFSDFTVLNRILPLDGSGLPVSRVVALNGTVQSQIVSSTGGSVWFYAPGGIIAGASSVFNVGSLVLTGNDIDTTGGLFGSAGEIRFRGVAGSAAAVEVQPGAQINALASGSYVALVAPRVVQGGTVTVNGSAAYVGAEAADITINGGLFDISITAGTTDPNGVVHSGTTARPATSVSTDAQHVYMVAVPKNNALTMLLSGNVGYSAAETVVQDGSAVVLSAGHDIVSGAIGARNATTAADANVTIDAGTWQPGLTGRATGEIVVQSNAAPTTHFGGPVSLAANRAITLRADPSGLISADGDMVLTAGNGGTGGRIDLLTFGGSGASATNGQIAVTGALTLNASALGDGSANVPLLTGGNATGGLINVIATGGSISAASLTANAYGVGGLGSDRSGDGTGGAVALSALTFAGPNGAEGGTLSFGSTTLDASASTSSDPFFPSTSGGEARGGSIAITGTAGVAAVGSLGGLDLGAVSATASAVGGNAKTGAAGDAIGGDIRVNIGSGTHHWTSFSADASMEAGYATDGGTYGSAAPGATGIGFDIGGTGRLEVAGSVSLQADASAFGGGASGGTLRGGQIAVTAHDGGALVITDQLYATAAARGSSASATSTLPLPGTPATFGGAIDLAAAGGTISAAGLYANVSAASGGTPGLAGAATAGSVTLSAGTASGLRGNFTLSDCARLQCDIQANGNGGYGRDGASGAGGSILVQATDADFSVNGDLTLSAAGVGGGAFSPDGVSGRGGDGQGGSVAIESRAGVAGSAVMSFTNIFASADGSSTEGTEGPFYNGGNGGTGIGGAASLLVAGGSFNAGSVAASALGRGGASDVNCAGCEGDGVTPFQSGTGRGGTAKFLITGGSAGLGSLSLTALGTGGEARSSDFPAGAVASISGQGIGGAALLESRGGTLLADAITIDASGVGGDGVSTFQADGVKGGAGSGGTAQLLMDVGGTGQVSASSGLIIQALGKGGAGGATASDGPGFYLAGAGGNGTGGTAGLTLASGQLTAPSVLLSAAGVGGAGGDNASDGPSGSGGAGLGGTASLAYLSEGHAIGALTVKADGDGGQAGSNRYAFSYDINGNPIYTYGIGNADGGAGGAGQGGNATMQVDVDPGFANLTVSADGIGSAGGIGINGGAGGVGTGGAAAFNIGFGTTSVSGALRVTASGLGGAGGDGLDGTGGRGGNAFGGSATLGLTGASALLDAGDIGVLAEALGGAGGFAGQRSGAGLPGANGGDAQGGTALFAITSGANALTGASLTVSGDASGGVGSTGTIGPVGGAGGSGGGAAAGSATLRLDGGRLRYNSALSTPPGYSITAVGRGGAGAGGSAGTNAGLSGGAGGNGGSGSGGTASFDAKDADFVLGALSVDADGTGGLAGTGGKAPGGSSSPGLDGLSSGGTASLTHGGNLLLAPGAQRLIASLSMRATGTTGGRLLFSDDTSAPGGAVGISGALTLDGSGATLAGFTGIAVSASGNPVQVGGDASFTTEGPLTFALAGSGAMAVTGTLTGYSGTGINISHASRTAGVASLSAGNTLLRTAGGISLGGDSRLSAGGLLTMLALGGDIGLSSGTSIMASGDLRFFAQGNVLGAGASLTAGGSVAIGLGGAGNLLLGNVSSGGLLDQSDANGAALGSGGLAIGGDFAVSGLLAVGPGSGTLSARSISIGTLTGGSQSLSASGGVTIGDATLAGLLNIATPGLVQMTGSANAGAIDIVAGSIGLGAIIARTGDLRLRSVANLSVTSAQASGNVQLASSGGSLAVGSALAGGTLTLSGAGISAQALGAGGGASLDAGGGDLVVNDIAAQGAISAVGRNILLGATGAMSITDVIGSGVVALNAGGPLSASGQISGSAVSLASSDIVLGGGARIVTPGQLHLAAVGLQPAVIGGVDAVGGYSLSAAELARVSAANMLISGAGDIVVRDLSVGATMLPGAGVLSILTHGRLRVEGALRVTGRTGQGGLSLSAGQRIEVIADTGFIELNDGSGGLAGVLTLSSPAVYAASLAAIADVDAVSSLAAREVRLSRNDGLVSDAGLLRAGSIAIDARNGVYIQNGGVSARFDDRRGFTANSLSILGGSGRPEIAINGRLALSTGTFATGLSTIPLVAISGSYAAGSKINGCFIAGAGACTASGAESHDNFQGRLDPTAFIPRIFPLALVQLRDIIAQGYPPLIDEPVTGAGNEDLWESDCGGEGEPSCAAQ